ncbi:hypothetical protein EYF80_008304 [Liparis tanakae]|uniref:Uncharacterized protein n=1 Tax=Liparis tanakae TaxID=230148 RepID=A0A4Z2IW89_9TELE|nr:hypothetical protein EYF80_008304 [Liparis tanakae]
MAHQDTGAQEEDAEEETWEIKQEEECSDPLPCIMTADVHPMLPSAKHDVDSLHPQGPNSQTPAQGGGVGEDMRGSSSSSSGGHSQRRHPRNMQQIGGWGGRVLSSPLCVLVRPRPPEQHRHTPSLRGGTLRKGKGEKSKAGTGLKRLDTNRDRPLTMQALFHSPCSHIYTLAEEAMVV